MPLDNNSSNRPARSQISKVCSSHSTATPAAACARPGGVLLASRCCYRSCPPSCIVSLMLLPPKILPSLLRLLSDEVVGCMGAEHGRPPAPARHQIIKCRMMIIRQHGSERFGELR